MRGRGRGEKGSPFSSPRKSLAIAYRFPYSAAETGHLSLDVEGARIYILHIAFRLRAIRRRAGRGGYYGKEDFALIF